MLETTILDPRQRRAHIRTDKRDKNSLNDTQVKAE